MTDMILLSLVCTFALALVHSDGMRRFVRLIAAFAMLVVIARPCIHAVESMEALPNRVHALLTPIWETGAVIEQETRDWVIDRGVENLKNGIATFLCARYPMDSSFGTIEIEAGENASGEVVIEGVQVCFSVPADVDAVEIERVLSELLLCPCEVIFSTAEEEANA